MKEINQVFSVPNDTEGEYFMYLANKFLNHDSYQLRRRGRTPDREAMKKDGKNPRCYQQHTPLEYAQNFGVYLMAKLDGELTVTGIQQASLLNKLRREHSLDYSEITHLRNELDRLNMMKSELSNLRRMRESLLKTIMGEEGGGQNGTTGNRIG